MKIFEVSRQDNSQLHNGCKSHPETPSVAILYLGNMFGEFNMFSAGHDVLVEDQQLSEKGLLFAPHCRGCRGQLFYSHLLPRGAQMIPDSSSGRTKALHMA